MKCLLCGREAAADLCEYHQAARDRIESVYSLWAKAYGQIDRKTYLDRVITNTQTGQWAKEVARLLKDGLDDKRAN